MTARVEPPLIPPGTRVMIRDSGFKKACVVLGYVGTFGPERTRLYRVRFRKSRPQGFATFPEDRLEVLPPRAKPELDAPSRPAEGPLPGA